MKSAKYSRQIILPEIGLAGQIKLKSSRVLCVGAGGLGSPVLLYLTAAGVGTIGIIDPDHVDESNLHRQVLYKIGDQGKSKVDAAQNNLNELNPDVRIIPYYESFSHLNAETILSNYDLVIDGSDNFETKFLINDAAYRMGIPLVYGAISGFDGEVAFFWGKRGACYRCFHPTLPKAQIQNCAEAGVLGSVAGIVGSLQATLALQYLVSFDSPAHPLYPSIGQLSILNLVGTWNMRNLKINKNINCPTCSLKPTEVKLQFSAPTCTKAPSINSDELLELLKGNPKNTLLIDVREDEEWNAGKIPGAIHWPLSRLEEGSYPVPSAEVKKVIAYCKAGIRSERAVQILTDSGISNSYSLNGGFDSFNP